MNGTSTFLQACENLCGGVYFSVVGDDKYENVKWLIGSDWLSDESKIPTKEQVLAEVTRIKNQELYKKQRTGQIVDGEFTTDTIYPPIGEQLDYIYHHGIDKWKTDIVDPVKTKYPKPE